ncbi:ligase-associated DNA damage response endonuclease PdeM [Cellulophaga sp. Hel_I_12]|uniref:ligase-associated DNA damage response endonuclease PdeM n=1 Tax=Cellulophaga sp. Hel_I_12 TaxID=1249972 RepID=UPI0006489885|nr:ligase-associated DNA damage response endonuclease PdeM [Cellulophaga sp. Hel_I_12]
MTETITINEQTFIMHCSGALLWQEKEILLISDVHFGKVSHFRKFGAAVPQKAIAKNFELLNEVLALFKPKQLFFLGDLFHSSLNQEWLLFNDWVSSQKLKITLVKGNHDIISDVNYTAIGIDCSDEVELDDFLFTHHPEERETMFNFSGHIHPAIKLQGAGRQSLKLPCFFKSENQLILPAFGTFTGTFTLKPTAAHQVFAITKDSVFAVPLSH